VKGIHQIYLFIATLAVAAGFFIKRALGGNDVLFEVGDVNAAAWEVRHFDEALLGGDSLNWAQFQNEFTPFIQSNPNRAFWELERRNPQLRDHFTNVQNLMDKDAIARDLGTVSAHAEALLGLPQPTTLYFYISGIDLESPCLYYPGSGPNTTDQFAFVGLDNFLGAGYPGYSGIPEYQRALLRQSQLPVAYAKAILATLNFQNLNDLTLLSEMVYQGKIAVAAEALCGYEVSTAEVLGYSQEEFAFLTENERNIWEVMVREKLLFSTDMMVRQRLSEPAPFSKLGTAMDGEIPGRVARFIGYELVKSYAQKHPETTLKELLQNRDAKKFLRDAQYKP
jgi:hypothetical protein